MCIRRWKTVGGNAYVIRNADSFKFKNVAAAAIWNEEDGKLIELPGLYQEKHQTHALMH